MAVMKEDLKLLLRRNGVHDDVCNWLAASPQDCHDIKVLANIVDEANQLKATVLSHTSQKDNIGQLARFKQAWKEADGINIINQTRLKRLGQGIAEDALDEPLLQVACVLGPRMDVGRWPGVVNILSWMVAQPVIVPCNSHASLVPMTGAYVMPCADAPSLAH